MLLGVLLMRHSLELLRSLKLSGEETSVGFLLFSTPQKTFYNQI